MDYYYFPASHWSRVTSLVLAEKGIEPTRHFVDIRAHDTFEPAYIRLNPKGVVPTIVHDGRPVCNSLRIAAYLDTIAGPRLYGPDAGLRARVQELEAFPLMLFSYSVWVQGTRGERSAQILDEKITLARANATRHPALREQYERKARFFEAFRAEVYDPARVAAARARWGSYLDAMAEAVRARPWLCGDAYTYADCIATSVLYRLHDLRLMHEWHDVPGHPLRAYLERLKARPSFTRVWQTDPLLARLG